MNEKNILNDLNWRYATKSFDVRKKLDDNQVSLIFETLRLTPSSFGLQPWKFLAITESEIRAKLKPYAWNQPQITDASHLIVMCRKSDFTLADVDRYVNYMAEVEQDPVENYQFFRDMASGFVAHADKTFLDNWQTKQVYIALGNLMTVCAIERIDACPIEGFEPEAFDRILNLKQKGIKSVVLCAIGFRASDDKYARKAKVRYPVKEIIETL